MNKLNSLDEIKTKTFADKSIEGNLSTAIKFSLAIESEATRKNTASFNANRYRETSKIRDYEELKNKAREIKEYSINKIHKLLTTLQYSIEHRGGKFYLAKNEIEANNYIADICLKYSTKLIVKAKSITTEEIKLNTFLEKRGIEIAETDLAEFILQIADEQPSHIVAPAIHRSRERISKLFKEKFNTDYPLESGEDLTKFAKDILRKKFITADIGITGANAIVAETGTLLLVESEGNIRMVTQAPSVHIAIAGIEKIIPTYNDLIPFIELLAPSATGQPLSSYTHLINPPLDLPAFSFDGRNKGKREFYLVLIDNGRMQMRDDPILKEALYCIRCSACMNSCANFQVLGGHAFGGETYSGGIGGSWEAKTGDLQKARFSELCTGCSRCVPNCPIKIDIPWLNENLRDRLNRLKKKSNKQLNIFQRIFSVSAEDINASLQIKMFANYKLVQEFGMKFNYLANYLLGKVSIKWILEKYFGMDNRRKLNLIPRKTFTSLAKSFNEKQVFSNYNDKLLLVADSFTNYMRPNVGIAALKIFNALKMETIVSKVFSEGRDSLSQGLISTTKERANRFLVYLNTFIEQGYKLIIMEPSILALFKKDYKHFISEKSFNVLKERSFDVCEYLFNKVSQDEFEFKKHFDLEKIAACNEIFYHGHCQQKSIGAYEPTLGLLKSLGFRVIVSNVECCGMAGSFGYKKEFYNVSIKVGEILLNQIKNASEKFQTITVVTSGFSCSEQIHHLSQFHSMHPLELLSKYIIA